MGLEMYVGEAYGFRASELCNFLSTCPSLQPIEAEHIMQIKHVFVGLLSGCK